MAPIQKLRHRQISLFAKLRQVDILYIFIGCAVLTSFTGILVFYSNIENYPQQSHISPTRRCALLFFGLPKQFRTKSLPSIRKYILKYNPTCDVFLHTYNITNVTTPRNFERGDIAPEETYLLTNHVVMDTDETFASKRNLDDFRKYHHKEWGPCCQSTDNMIKQWHSIDAVWNLMERHARQKQREGTRRGFFARWKKLPPYYERVGLFRSDVLYLNPINITDGDAVIPKFLYWDHPDIVNDRMFYGLYDHSKIWATGRFPLVEEYVAAKHEIHSETFVRVLLQRHEIPYEKKDVCFWRLRADGRVSVKDCALSGDRAKEHLELLDGLICEKADNVKFNCSVYLDQPELLAKDEQEGFARWG